MPEESTTYFISYAREDADFALKLAQDLRDSGAEVWIDQLDIKTGERWARSIERALISCSGLIFILSPDSVHSDNVMDEVEYALDKGKKVLPLMYRQVELPFRIRRRHYTDFTSNYEKGLKRLKRDLKLAAPSPKPDPEETRDQEEEQAWKNAVAKNSIPGFQAYLKRYPSGTHVREAQKHIARLRIVETPLGEKKVESQKNTLPDSNRRIWIGGGVVVILSILFGVWMSQPVESDPGTSLSEPLSRSGSKEETDLPDMVFVQGGTFTMGCTAEQGGDCDEDESPTRQVTLSSFYIGRHEVTVQEFSYFINDSGYRTDAEKGDGSYLLTGSNWEKKAGIDWRFDAEGNRRPTGEYNHPVIHVSWYDAVAYCNWRSDQEGLQEVYHINGTNVSADWSANGYRLPTEAEWEYAARSRQNRDKWAGTSSESQLSSYANISGESDGYKCTAPVGSFRSNGLGLHDMTGNVWEWCWDWKGDYPSGSERDPKGPSSGTSRVLRGGSWNNSSRLGRVSSRFWKVPVFRYYFYGFRLSRN